MKCRILHESKNRMRIHLYIKHMTCKEADKAEYFLLSLPYVRDVKVSERTSDATVRYDESKREELINDLSHFDMVSTEIAVPEHTSRELNHQFQDRLFFHIAKRLVMKMIVPMPIKKIGILTKAIPYAWNGLRSLKNKKMNVAVLDATSILVSVIRGDYNTAGSIMFLLEIGDITEAWTRKKSVNDLARAMALNVDKAWKIDDEGQEICTDIGNIVVGDVVVVRTGNMIPLDGVVISGDASVSQASITGEGLPVHKTEGGYVYAGTVVEEGDIKIIVKKTVGTCRYDRITKMIEDSEKLKSATEQKAFNMADKLVPYTFGATALTYLFTRNVSRAVSILMVDYCCAIKLSMPIAVLPAMREAGESHIAVKGGKFLEAMADADTIIFDKTGTLTYATPRVVGVTTFDDADEDEVLRLAACLEEHYPHSMANAVVKAAEEKGLLHEEKHSKVEYVVAHGIASSIDGEKVVIGSYHFIFEDEGCTIEEEEKTKFENLSDEFSHLYLAIGGRVKAVILIEDPVKEESAEVIKKLQQLGLRVVMLTGDSSRVARRVAGLLGVDDYRAQMLPEEKAEYVRTERNKGRVCVMIGDGVNDSPALSESDAGISINSGAAIAREVADIMLSEDSLELLVTLRKLSCALKKRTEGNYKKIVTFNSFLILMGALGVFQPTLTALLHNGSTIAISVDSMTNLIST